MNPDRLTERPICWESYVLSESSHCPYSQLLPDKTFPVCLDPKALSRQELENNWVEFSRLGDIPVRALMLQSYARFCPSAVPYCQTHDLYVLRVEPEVTILDYDR